ncbi:hypothetical protein Cch01nite_28320 [Cellulomonas chitinilytica]|uniref:Lipoprotein n=1 Tax=Cellulomonas chitinilytica TaxID=398759 RepID=A0A919P539_9CELL|nr:hypothetical protein [Cellulomonas chitinilytica]GIG22108.1 hypothetical protein Cch01nite_28320 [Cellulomonas chitinilytica]
MAARSTTGRAWTALALASAVLVGASACTTDDPGPSPRPTSADAAPTAPPPVAVTTPAPSVAASPSPAAPVATSALVCVPGDDDLDLTQLRRVGGIREDLAPSDFVMVEVGPGNDPQETWWVVAAPSYSDAWGDRDKYNPVSYLTTAPNGGPAPRWIYVGRALQAPAGTADWSDVDWTGDRLARGQQAQALALSCLGSPST